MAALGTARPASAFEPLVLLSAVREIAEFAGAPKPEDVSTRSWDRSRPLSEQFADVPAARRICEHLELTWAQVLRLAFLDDHARGRALGLALNEQFPEWLTSEYADFILRLVARRLGVDTLTPAEYRAETQRMLSADRPPAGCTAATFAFPPTTRLRLSPATGTVRSPTPGYARARASGGRSARWRR